MQPKLSTTRLICGNPIRLSCLRKVGGGRYTIPVDVPRATRETLSVTSSGVGLHDESLRFSDGASHMSQWERTMREREDPQTGEPASRETTHHIMSS